MLRIISPSDVPSPNTTVAEAYHATQSVFNPSRNTRNSDPRLRHAVFASENSVFAVAQFFICKVNSASVRPGFGSHAGSISRQADCNSVASSRMLLRPPPLAVNGASSSLIAASLQWSAFNQVR